MPDSVITTMSEKLEAPLDSEYAVILSQEIDISSLISVISDAKVPKELSKLSVEEE